VDQAEVGLQLLRPARLSTADFKGLIKTRGWRMADAAVRWDVRPETLSRVAANPQRDTRWDDLVRALPLLSRRERTAATAARLRLFPPRVRPPVTAQDTAPAQLVRLPPLPFDWAEEEDELAPSGPAGNGYRYQEYVGLGSELVVVNEIGSLATEGTVLVVINTRLGMTEGGHVQEEYCCEALQGTMLWLTPDQMDDWVVSTGKTRVGFR
jgi:hypothetical protein